MQGSHRDLEAFLELFRPSLRALVDAVETLDSTPEEDDAAVETASERIHEIAIYFDELLEYLDWARAQRRAPTPAGVA